MSSLYKNLKVKCTFVQALRLCTGFTAHRGSRGIALLFLDHGTRRGSGVRVTARPLFLNQEKTRYPLCRRMGGLQGRFGQVRKTSLPPVFDPRTFHPVASRYTDWATRSTLASTAGLNFLHMLLFCLLMTEKQLNQVFYDINSYINFSRRESNTKI